MNLKGCYVALVTPFTKKNNVDYDKIKHLVEFHIKMGTSGIIPVGTTGESPTLTKKEHLKIIETVIFASNQRIQVIPGTGSNNTEEVLYLTKFSKELGANAVLVVLPYYNRPSQEGLFQHFKKICEIGIDLILYNIPGRTGINLLPNTLLRIKKECNNIIGVKESSGMLDQISEISIKVKGISILSGDDSLTLPILSVGGVGVISVIANFAPYIIDEMISYYFEGRVKEAQAIHHKLYPMCKALLTFGSNPAPVKYIMSKLDFNVGIPRLPIVELNKEKKVELDRILEKLEITPIL